MKETVSTTYISAVGLYCTKHYVIEENIINNLCHLWLTHRPIGHYTRRYNKQ